jgi:hypothetical protein
MWNGFDDQSLAVQFAMLLAFLPMLSVYALSGFWALWRLHQRPRKGWLMLGAIGLSGMQVMFASMAFPLLLWLMSLLGGGFSGEAFSLILAVGHQALSLLTWWLLTLGVFGPTPFRKPDERESIANSPLSISGPVMWSLIPILSLSLSVLGTLAVLAILLIASRQQGGAKPHAAKWTQILIGAQLLSAVVPWVSMALGIAPTLPQAENIAATMRDPQLVPFLGQCWLSAIPAVGEWLIASYLVLEQPDAPRRQRPVPESAS